jgi:dihydroorotase
MQKYLIKNINIVNEGKIELKDVLIAGERIEKIGNNIAVDGAVKEIDGENKYLLPGLIDDQVHFREPGLTHKATIATESTAAVAGGITSFMEMPNTIPNALTIDLLEEKYKIASQSSLANYSFFMGVSNSNSEEALRINDFKKSICGLKIFMGSSTGNMLVDSHTTLDKIFGGSEVLIATHCEDERIIKNNLIELKKVKDNFDPADHPIIRNEEACYESSLTAIQFANKYCKRITIVWKYVSAKR